MEIRETVAVVTGAASGIGRAIAAALAARGARVVLADINPDRLRVAAQELSDIGHDALAAVCDVCDDSALETLRERTEAAFGPADILVNNAGTGIAGPPYAIPLDDWRSIIDLNLLSVVRGVNAFVPGFVSRRRGWVVNTASIGGMYAYDHSDAHLPYIATKFAVRGLSEALYLNVRPQGVGVSCLCPGRVETNIAEGSKLAGTDDLSWVRVPRLNGVKQPGPIGEQVAAAITDERFLVLVDDEDASLIAARYADLDAALQRQVAAMSRPQGPAYGWD